MTTYWTEDDLRNAVLRMHGPGAAQAMVGPVGSIVHSAPPVITHKAFQAAIVRLAQAHAWKAHYTANSRKSPAGWFDLILARPGDPLLIAELKVGNDTLSPDQQDWLRILRAVPGIEVYVWHGPDAWPQIDARLTQPRKETP